VVFAGLNTDIIENMWHPLPAAVSVFLSYFANAEECQLLHLLPLFLAQ